MKVTIRELGLLYKYMCADCERRSNCKTCKYCGFCNDFESTEVEIPSHIYKVIEERAFGD